MAKRLLIILIIGALLIVGELSWPVISAWTGLNRHQRLVAGLAEVQRAVEAYGVDHNGEYPQSLTEVLAAGELTAMPENPYTHRPMPVLDTNAEPRPGGVVYYAWGPFDAAVGYRRDRYLLAVYGVQEVDEFNAPDTGWHPRCPGYAISWRRVVYLLTNAG